MPLRFAVVAACLLTAGCARSNPRFGAADDDGSPDPTTSSTGSTVDNPGDTRGDDTRGDDAGTTILGANDDTGGDGVDTAVGDGDGGSDSAFIMPVDVGPTRRPGAPCIDPPGGLNCWDFDDVQDGMWVMDQVGDAVLSSDDELTFVPGLFGTALDCRAPHPCALETNVGPGEAWVLEIWFDASAGGNGWSAGGGLLDLVNADGSQVQIRTDVAATRQVVMSFNGQGVGFNVDENVDWMCAAIRHGVSDTTFELYDDGGLIPGAPHVLPTASLGNNDFMNATLLIGNGTPGSTYVGFIDGVRLRDELDGGACTPL